MSRRAVPEEGNVTRLLPPAREETIAEVSTPRAEALRYIQNMTLEACSQGAAARWHTRFAGGALSIRMS